MKAFSGFGIGLSLVLGCFLLALVAEVYYLLRWRKKKNKRITSAEVEEEYRNNYAKEIIQLFCFKKPSSQQVSNESGDEIERNPDGNLHEQQDIELGSSKDLLLKALSGEGGFEAELMKLHNQRFLFTIKEETKEDLESDDGKSRKGSRTRSLSDLVVGVNDNNTPSFVTPLASPPLKSSPLNPNLESYHHRGFNPLFESVGELEFNTFRPSSPPPKFKFLRDAEDKLMRKLAEEAKSKCGPVQDSILKTGNSSNPNQEALNEIEGSFLKFINSAKNREKQNLQQLPEITPSSSSQVLPLASSPTNLRPLDQKPIVD